MANVQNLPFVRDRFTWLAYFMLAYFAYMQAALGPLMPFLRASLNFSYTVAGLHLSAFAVGMVLAGLMADRAARYFGRYAVFWGGGMGMGVGAILFILSGRAALTISSIFLMGWLGTFLLVMIQALLSDHHGQRRTIPLTESNVGASLSAAMAPLSVGIFQRSGIGWQGALVLGTLVLLLLYLKYRNEPVPEEKKLADAENKKRALPPVFWAYWVVVVLGVSVEWCMIFWGADFLISRVGFSPVNAATIMSVFFAAMVVGRYVGSRLSRIISSSRLLLFAFGVTLVGFPIFWLAPVPILNIIGLFITGFGVANLFPLTLSVAVGVAADQANAASGRTTMGGGLAILSAPLILGWTADQLDIFYAYGLVLALLIVATIVVFTTNRAVSKKQG